MRSQRALGRPPRDRDRESGPHDGGAFAHPCNVITACDELTILEVLSNPMLCHAVPPQVGFDHEAKRAVAQQDGEACLRDRHALRPDVPEANESSHGGSRAGVGQDLHASSGEHEGIACDALVEKVVAASEGSLRWRWWEQAVNATRPRVPKEVLAQDFGAEPAREPRVRTKARRESRARRTDLIICERFGSIGAHPDIGAYFDGRPVQSGWRSLTVEPGRSRNERW